jgi:salicylate hydroxylase
MSDPILIAGAGIGGLSAALALARAGIPSHIVERTASIREIGAGIQLGPNGFRAFGRLGIAGAMDAISFRPETIRLIDSVDGVELSRQTLGAPFEARFRYPYRVAYRADVQQVLLAAVREQASLVTIELGDGVVSVKQDSQSVRVQLDSGQLRTGPALIGADGIWSLVRRTILDDAPPSASGHIAYRAVLPIAALPEHLATDDVQVWIGPGHHLVCYKLRGGLLFNIIAIIHSDRALEGWDTLGDEAALTLGFADACKTVKDLLGQIQDWRMWALSDRNPQQGWTQGRITLLGDAAHPMLPYLAQGACMAIEDAVVLADQIAGHRDDLPAALRSYETMRFARTASVQRAARETGVINHATGAAREARNAFLAGRRADDYESMAWLFGGEGARPEAATGSEIGIFGRHAETDA